jgi:hypothetical protein
VQHQTIDINEPPAARTFDFGDSFGEFRLLGFFNEWDARHGVIFLADRRPNIHDLRGSQNDEEEHVALWMRNLLAMMLLTPHLYAHDLTLMVVPTALFLRMWDGPIPWLVPSLLIFTGVFRILSFVVGPRVPPPVPMIFLAGYSLCIWQARKTNKLRVNCVAAIE